MKGILFLEFMKVLIESENDEIIFHQGVTSLTGFIKRLPIEENK
jgi:hypothetical protein